MYLSLRFLEDNLAHCHLLPTCRWWHLQHCSEGKEQCMPILIKILQLNHRKKLNHCIQFISKMYFIEQHYSITICFLGVFSYHFFGTCNWILRYNYYHYFILLKFFQEKVYLCTMTIKQLNCYKFSITFSMNILLIYCSIPHFVGQLPGHVQ